MTASTRRELHSAATSTSTTAIGLIRALTDARPIKPTSTRCLSARRPNPGRGSTYRRGNSVQTTAATSDLDLGEGTPRGRRGRLGRLLRNDRATLGQRHRRAGMTDVQSLRHGQAAGSRRRKDSNRKKAARMLPLSWQASYDGVPGAGWYSVGATPNPRTPHPALCRRGREWPMTMVEINFSLAPWTFQLGDVFVWRVDPTSKQENLLGSFQQSSVTIPALRDDPKLVGRDDTKVVGDSVAKAVPFFGNSSPEEAQDCRSELREGFIASVIGDMFVHYAPASFDRIKMRTIGRDEVQPDPASRLPQPLTH